MAHRGLGDLVIRVVFDTHQVQSVRLSIPLLGIDEYIPREVRFQNIPAGFYEGYLLGHSGSGKEIRKSIKVQVVGSEENVHTYALTGIGYEVMLQPVDERDRTILNSELKVLGVDINYRTVRDWKGISYSLSPGEYQVQILLPTLEVRTVPVTVLGDVHAYKLQVHTLPKQSRIEPRIDVSLRAAYWTIDGSWANTQCVNISTRGVCILSRLKKIETNGSFIRLFVPVTADPIECSAKVRWTKDEDHAEGRIGLEMYLPDTVKSTVSHWLEDLQATLH